MSWKIFHGGPGKSWKSPGIFVSKRMGTLCKLMYSFLSLLYKCDRFFVHVMMNSDIYSWNSVAEYIVLILFTLHAKLRSVF